MKYTKSKFPLFFSLFKIPELVRGLAKCNERGHSSIKEVATSCTCVVLLDPFNIVNNEATRTVTMKFVRFNRSTRSIRLIDRSGCIGALSYEDPVSPVARLASVTSLTIAISSNFQLRPIRDALTFCVFCARERFENRWPPCTSGLISEWLCRKIIFDFHFFFFLSSFFSLVCIPSVYKRSNIPFDL